MQKYSVCKYSPRNAMMSIFLHSIGTVYNVTLYNILSPLAGYHLMHLAAIDNSKGDWSPLVSQLCRGNFVDVNFRCLRTGKTPLMVSGGKMAKTLLDHGAEPNMKDRKGKSVLHYAIQNRDWDLCILLSEAGGYAYKQDKKLLDRVPKETIFTQFPKLFRFPNIHFGKLRDSIIVLAFRSKIRSFPNPALRDHSFGDREEEQET